jgi:ferric-dicitrate binding protein FerR (iron transport regulator)
MPKLKHIEAHSILVVAPFGTRDAAANAQEFIRWRMATAMPEQQQQELIKVRNEVNDAAAELEKRAEQLYLKDQTIEKLQARICALLATVLFMGLILLIMGGFAWQK